MTTDTKTESLKRQLGFWDSVFINVGIIVGVGIFRTPGEIAKYLSTPSTIIYAWILGGVLSLLGVFCYAELSSRIPETGGTYAYLRKSYGKLVAFLYGWIEFSILRAASIAAVAYILTAYLGILFPWVSAHDRWISILLIWIFTGVNIVGVRVGTGVQNALSIMKIIMILTMFFVIYKFSPHFNLFTTYRGLIETSHLDLTLLATAMIPVLFSYGGWHESTFMSGEFKDTRAALPLSLFMGIAIVTCLYVIINMAYLNIFTPAQMMQSKAIASDIFRQFMGPVGGTVVAVCVLISATGALNSNILTGARIPFAVAQDAKLIRWLGHVDEKFETPLRSLILNAVWASVLVMFGTFENLLFFAGFSKWLFFALAGTCVFVLRKKGIEKDVFLTPGYPFVPFFFVLSSLWLCLASIIHAPWASLIGLAIIFCGIPLYYAVQKNKL